MSHSEGGNLSAQEQLLPDDLFAGELQARLDYDGTIFPVD
jgi:hypothetical protein